MIRISKLLAVIMLVIYGSFITGCTDHDHSDAESPDHAIETTGIADDHAAEEAPDDDDDDTDHEVESLAEDDDHNHEADAIEADGHDHSVDEAELIDTDINLEQLIGLETDVARIRPLEISLTVPAEITPNQNNIAVISPFIETSINMIFANIGNRVKKGDILGCLASPEIGIVRAEHVKSSAELEIKQQLFQRQLRLYEDNIIPQRTFEEAELELKIAELNNEYALKKLRALGISENSLNESDKCHENMGESAIHIGAPISGIITERNAHIGQKVDSSIELFEIIDLSSVWLEADIFEKDIIKISIGQKVSLKVAAFDDIFTGVIFHIGNKLNRETKTMKILAEISNKNELLKPGMYASASIVIGKRDNALIIPKEALLKDENLDVIFVKEADGYHRHVVDTGIGADGFIEITAGIEQGDIVVTKGNYQLKSREEMNAADPHAGHNH